MSLFQQCPRLCHGNVLLLDWPTILRLLSTTCRCPHCPLVADAVRARVDCRAMLDCDVSAEVLHSDTMDQFRTFHMCERLLHCPVKLSNQLLFQIPPQSQSMLIERFVDCCMVNPLNVMIVRYSFSRCFYPKQCSVSRGDLNLWTNELSPHLLCFPSPVQLPHLSNFTPPVWLVVISHRRYYEFDSSFAREVLGKKLSKGTKRDLEDVSSKTGVSLKSCRRQVGLTPWRRGTSIYLFVCWISATLNDVAMDIHLSPVLTLCVMA